jgi:glycosyltransferase involved in cell wall biosynthesis
VISIVTINKNNASGLTSTIESVVSQSYPNVDFIVVDGDSTDGSKEVLKHYHNKIASCLSEPDTGIYDAMNKGIRLSKGDYLIFLNSGDCFNNPYVLEKIAPQLKDYDVISGDIVIEDEKGIIHTMQSQDEIFLDFFLNMSLYHQATFISKKAFETYGLYNQSFKLGGDYEFFIRLFFKYNATYYHINELVSNFKTDGISNNPDFSQLNKTEAKRAWQLNVSDRTYTIFIESQQFKDSSVYWMYLKTTSSNVYKKIFLAINLLRTKLYRFIK